MSISPRLLFFAAACSFFTCAQNVKDAPEEEEISAYTGLSLEEKLSPQHATASFTTAEGVDVNLFASEPMVVNPTNMAVDAKGRVWVCESYNYAVPKDQQTQPGGRIVILEDSDHDGRADIRKVFYQGDDVHLAIGIAVLGDKVYVTRSPDLLVFTDRDHDDVPDSKEKLFTGMGSPGDHSAHAVVFGPDGKMYFNMGNMGKGVYDSVGKPVVDRAGNEVIQNGENYLGGMIFRCNMDGSEFEVIAHNFRNNYEVAVDSYGNLWQSDNDDDGNKSCRINFILEYGNYGYLDEVTRAGWATPRTNMEEEIPRRHWHQNDPGVVPNLLITGAGSPAGIVCYEGDALPVKFRNQVIHADAGPNVVRAYPVEKAGAGYSAETENLLKSVYDQWFRPVDVSAAPDGSLFVADWYDPIVGGAAAGDAQRGRVFRIAHNVSAYNPGEFQINSVEQALHAFASANMDRRYQGWQYLHGQGRNVRAQLIKLVNGDDPVMQARALWLMSKIDGLKADALELALSSDNPSLRIVGVRIARQSDGDFLTAITPYLNDPAPEVRREISIGLHLLHTPAAARTWAQLATQYDGHDRWYLEALGIGAAGNWDLCMKAWLNAVEQHWNTSAGRDIVMRSRSGTTSSLLAKMIADEQADSARLLRAFRAMDFQDDPLKNGILLALLESAHPRKEIITALVLQHIQPEKVTLTSPLRRALEETLMRTRGTVEFVNLVSRFELTDKKGELLEIALTGDPTLSTQSARVLLSEKFNGSDLLQRRIVAGGPEALALIGAIEPIGSSTALTMLSSVVMNDSLSLEVRKRAVLALGKTWGGEDRLLACVKLSEFDKQLGPAAASVLFNVYRVSLQDEAAKYLNRPGNARGKELPPIRTLVANIGDASDGKVVFDMYCQTCHTVAGNGVPFGPDLSEIGEKLAKEGLFQAILYPSEGISYDYHGVVLELKDGSRVSGIVISDTPEYIELRMAGGITNRYPVSGILNRTQQEESLMPALAPALSEDQLVNLVEYLTTLRKSPL